MTQAPTQIRRAYADSRWGQLHYRVAGAPAPGNRPPLLMLHQTPASSWEYEPLLPPLGTDRVVVAADTPGYGASSGPPGPVRIEDYANDLLQLMADLARTGVVDTGPFDVMGMHTGSVTATQMALAGGERVRRIILLGLAAYDQATRTRKLADLDNYAKPKADLSHVETLWAIMQELADPRTSHAWRHRWLAENLVSGAAMSNGYLAVYRYDFQTALSAVTAPALVLRPDDDLAEATGREAGRLRNGRMVALPNAKHGLLELDTDHIVGLIRDFLDSDG